MLQVTLGLGLAVAMLWWGLPHFAKTSWAEVWHVLRTVPAWKAALFMGLVVAGIARDIRGRDRQMSAVRHGVA